MMLNQPESITSHFEKFWKVYLFIGSFFLFGIFFIFIEVYCEAQNELAKLAKKEIPYSDFMLEVIKALSQVLLISGVMSIMAELILRKRMLSDFRDSTSNILEEFFNKTLDNSVQYGFTGITQSLDFKDFFQSTEAGNEVLWLDTYAPGHTQWLELVELKALAGVKFKFLVLKPGCHEAELRSKEIGGRFEQTFNPELQIFIYDLMRISKKINTKSKKMIEVKMYDDLLALPFYIIKKEKESDFAATSFYLRKATGITFPHLEWKDNGNGSFVGILREYYNWKWAHASEIADDFLDTNNKKN